MTYRKKKLLIIQICLLLLGIFVILFTYASNEKLEENKIISKEDQKKIEKQLSKDNTEGDIFYNIEYSGFDIAGNRYILKSKEASNNKNSQELVEMKFVEAIFYFKDGTTLQVESKRGLYNNKTLDMVFEDNVNAVYEGSKLEANMAEYSNSKSFLTISGNVKVKDIKGTMFADKLLFDIKKQMLNIASVNDDKINTNINLK